MKHANTSFKTARRRLLTLLGLGATGTALAAMAGSKSLFAKQFLDDAPRVKNPEMVYDPDLQMMVDPKTREPVFQVAKKCSEWTARVTPGTDGPTGDGKTDYWDC